ncbi:MAG: hypothetical protein IT223_03510 [Crocinitomicaceae bacterium]|nr:hypothetical protein [Crocinitomicaceae bacterium]
MKKFLFVSLFAFLANSFVAQVGINPNGSAPDPSAGLDVNYSNKGFLPPRMTTVQRDAIQNPASGLIIFNTDCSGLNFNAGTPSLPNWVAVTAGNAAVASVEIAANPLGSVCSGTPIIYSSSVTHGGISPTYQWKKNGSDIPGATNPTYTENSPSDGDMITCLITSNEPCVTGSPALSNAIAQTVNQNLPATVSISVNPSGTVCSDDLVTFTATPTNGGLIPGYQWKKNNQDILGATSSSYVTTNLSDGDQLFCVMASNLNCVTGSPANSNSITMDVNQGGSGGMNFTYTGSAQTWVVPECVYSVTIEAWGASGGGSSTGGAMQAGKGGYTTGTLAVTPGETYYIYVGGQGQYQGNAGPNPQAAGGWNGGGNSGACQASSQPAGAGGGTDIRFAGNNLADRIMVAGGGGGCYANYDASRTGGAGGGLVGSSCPAGSSVCGGGSQSAGGQGGTQNGSLGQGGNDGNGDHDCGGGGGGGYYGGGANSHGAGGGGSSYISGYAGCDPLNHSSGKVFTNTQMQQGIQHGNGQVNITW